jgi:peroxiredoxin
MQLTFPLLSDPEKDAYRAYGLSSGKLRRIFGPGTIWAYVKLLAKGQMYHFRRSDFLQLGGDFVIDAAGVVRYEYRSGAPHDRPPVEQMIDVLGEI